MYEALILDLQERLKRFPPDEFNPDFCRIKGAFEALEAMNDLFADIQVENTERDREIERLKKCRHGCKIDCLLEEYNRVEAERDAAHKEIERMKDIMREHGIAVIPGKYPGGRSSWNVRRGAQGEG